MNDNASSNYLRKLTIQKQHIQDMEAEKSKGDFCSSNLGNSFKLTLLLLIETLVGISLTSRTLTVNDFSTDCAGLPLSVDRTMMLY